MSPDPTTPGGFTAGERPYEPTRDEVEGLISRAKEHPLGLEFLQAGALDSVSAIFETHAFVVDAARVILARAKPRSDA